MMMVAMVMAMVVMVVIVMMVMSTVMLVVMVVVMAMVEREIVQYELPGEYAFSMSLFHAFVACNVRCICCVQCSVHLLRAVIRAWNKIIQNL